MRDYGVLREYGGRLPVEVFVVPLIVNLRTQVFSLWVLESRRLVALLLV
jgi:hypothetical protein